MAWHLLILSHCLSHSLGLFQVHPVSTRASAHAVPSVHDFLPLTHPVFSQMSHRGLFCSPLHIFWTSVLYLLPSLSFGSYEPGTMMIHTKNHIQWFFSSLFNYLIIHISTTEFMFHEDRNQESLICSHTPRAEHHEGSIETSEYICVDWERKTPAQHYRHWQTGGQLWYRVYRTLRPCSI